MTVSTHATQKPARRGPLVSPGRTVLAASVAALLLLAVAAALFGWLWWTTPKVGRDAAEDERQKEVVALVHTGFQLMSAGDPGTAVRVFKRAEELAPEKQKPSLRKARLAAEEQSRTYGDLVESQKQVVQHLMAAQLAVDNRRYQEALTAAEAALVLDPTNARAQEIRTTAQAAQTRLQEQQARRERTPRRTQEEVATNTTVAEPEPIETTPAEEAVPQTARLRITFQSDMPGVASIMVHVNGESVLQRRVGEKGGIIWRRGSGGQIDQTVELAAGDAEVKVWVTPPGKVAKLVTRNGSFAGGSSRFLDVRLSESGVPTVSLN